MKRGLVLSGGGSKGAYIGGMLQYLKMDIGKEYDIYSSTSTGTLLQTLASINDFDSLKEAYTTISLDDIYKISPFKKSDNPEEAKLKLWSIIRMHLFRGEPTFGDNSNLKDLIEKFFPKNKYLKSLKMGKDLSVCVTNLSKVKEEYYTSKELGERGYKRFIDWTWVSASAVPFALLHEKNGDYYADGGFMEHMPIQKAIDMGATEIDCFSTKPAVYSGDESPEINNALNLIERMITVMMWEQSQRDIDAAIYEARDKDVVVNIYNAPRQLTKNPMYFDKKVMSDWWEEGYQYMKEIYDKDSIECKTTIKLKAKKGGKRI